jgi:alpha-ketoglutarate-dependent taurine dioxygenase
MFPDYVGEINMPGVPVTPEWFQLEEAETLATPNFLSKLTAALTNAGLAVIRGCPLLQNSQLLSLIRHFGKVAGDDDVLEGPIGELITRFDEFGICINKRQATRWHLDYSFKAHPANVALLYCVAPSEDDVRTHFCDMYQLWRHLPQITLDELAFVKAVHCFWNAGTGPVTMTNSTIHNLFFQRVNGEKIVLYYNDAKVVNFIGCSEATERAARVSIRELMNDNRRNYAHSWRAGDIVLFDAVGMAHRRDEIPGRSFRHMKYLRTVFASELAVPIGDRLLSAREVG